MNKQSGSAKVLIGTQRNISNLSDRRVNVVKFVIGAMCTGLVPFHHTSIYHAVMVDLADIMYVVSMYTNTQRSLSEHLPLLFTHLA